MKTRENELHEPKLQIEYVPYGQGYQIEADCPICGRYVGGAFYANVTEEQAIMLLKHKDGYFTYCPHCGARLKEENE